MLNRWKNLDPMTSWAIKACAVNVAVIVVAVVVMSKLQDAIDISKK